MREPFTIERAGGGGARTFVRGVGMLAVARRRGHRRVLVHLVRPNGPRRRRQRLRPRDRSDARPKASTS